MSMNLHVSGERAVTVNKTGKQSKQTVHFPLWQTPTCITKEAIRGTDPKTVYVEWVRSRSNDEEEPIYAEDDIWAERAPIGTRVVNTGEEHIQELIAWLAECEEEGYDIEFYEL